MLGEEVGEVVVGAHEGHADGVVFDDFADVEVTARDVFGLVVVLRVVREVARGLVVAAEERGPRRAAMRGFPVPSIEPCQRPKDISPKRTHTQERIFMFRLGGLTLPTSR